MKARLIWALGRVPGISHLLRWYARQYSDGSVVTIQSGLAEGLKWKRYHRYVNGYWTGQYEWPLQQLIDRELAKGLTFFDLGANGGFFSIIAARAVGGDGRVISVDPDPDNCASIREQRELNAFSHWEARHAAVSDVRSTMQFSFSRAGASTGHLGAPRHGEHTIDVETLTLDELASEYGDPDLIKVDVEGAETLVLRGGRRVINEVRPRWIIELHGPELAREVRDTFVGANYAIYSLDGREVPAEGEPPSHILARPR